jgi:Chromatin-associated proteins containing the HMG domain
MNASVQNLINSDSFPFIKPPEKKFPLFHDDGLFGKNNYDYKQKMILDEKFPSVEKELPPGLFSPPSTVMKEETAPVIAHGFNNITNLNSNFVSTDKKKKRRFLEIGSHSLRNLKKEFENKEDDEATRNKAIASLNDWINRRITGYLVFQNTISSKLDDKNNYREMGIHLNSVAGSKWKNLTEDERDEYKNLAKAYRKAFRKEIEEFENYEDLTDLIERLDTKIKKLKKE